MLRLSDIRVIPGAYDTLYELLKERTPDQNISHKQMPTYQEHLAFIASQPYRSWEGIVDGGNMVGSIYITKENEIGLFILKKYQRMGYGKFALKEIVNRYDGKTILANINPNNIPSKSFFQSNGFKIIQETYVNAQ